MNRWQSFFLGLMLVNVILVIAGKASYQPISVSCFAISWVGFILMARD